MEPKGFHRKLAAILSADVADYSHAGDFIRRVSNLAELLISTGRIPAACCDKIDPNLMLNTPPLGAGMVYFEAG